MKLGRLNPRWLIEMYNKVLQFLKYYFLNKLFGFLERIETITRLGPNPRPLEVFSEDLIIKLRITIMMSPKPHYIPPSFLRPSMFPKFDPYLILYNQSFITSIR